MPPYLRRMIEEKLSARGSAVDAVLVAGYVLFAISDLSGASLSEFDRAIAFGIHYAETEPAAARLMASTMGVR